jgi:GcrA cell cycle regulator
MDWNDEAIARLRVLWDEGHSTAEIGRRMAVSKNAVVGKAHRLNLPARPSPIRRDATGATPSRAAAPKRVTGPTLPPLPVTEPVRDVAVAIKVEPAPAPEPRPEPEMRIPARAPMLRPVTAPRNRTVSCCWPIGEPGTKSFRFCDAESNHNKPYCSEHAQLAYVKVRDRRDEAAA